MKINKQLFNLAQSKAKAACNIECQIECQIEWFIAMQYLRLAYEDD
ncbi:hypothetical protein [Photorhabdus heterorhabditis]|nr:hypothetical protein [Photorhabdus heterorhabditis]